LGVKQEGGEGQKATRQPPPDDEFVLHDGAEYNIPLALGQWEYSRRVPCELWAVGSWSAEKRSERWKNLAWKNLAWKNLAWKNLTSFLLLQVGG
jgi:hypothetical protein